MQRVKLEIRYCVLCCFVQENVIIILTLSFNLILIFYATISFTVLNITKLIIATKLKVMLLVMRSLIILAFVSNHDAIPAAVLQLN